MSADDNRLYKILGIANTKCSQDDIKNAYRRLSKKHHPDKGGNSDEFAEISKAYKTLVNPQTRETYDSESQLEIMAKQNIASAMKTFVTESINQVENPAQPVLFGALVEHFKESLRHDQAQLESVKVKQKRMLKMHDKVKLKHCDDVYKETLRSVSISLKHDVDVLLNNIELLEKINELLADYEADEPRPGEIIPVSKAQLDAQTGANRGGLFNW